MLKTLNVSADVYQHSDCCRRANSWNGHNAFGIVVRFCKLLHALLGFLFLLKKVEPHLASTVKRSYHFLWNQFCIHFKGVIMWV